VLTTLLLGTWELVLRDRGVKPSVGLESSWIAARDRVAPGVTVFVGTSRILTAIDLDVWQTIERGPMPVQLALTGGSSVPVLEDLARDPRAAGLVVAEVLPLHTFDATLQSEERPRRLIDTYHRARVSPARRVEARLRTLATGTLAIRRTIARPSVIASTWWTEHRLPEIKAGVLRTNRFQPMDYRRRIDEGWSPDTGFAMRHDLARRFGRPANPAELDAFIDRMERSAEAIRRHGGDIVFVLLPARGGRKRAEDERFPRTVYWDHFAHRIDARTIHADDYPGLHGMPCYDGSHMDMRDAGPFTEALAHIILQRWPGPRASTRSPRLTAQPPGR